MSYDEIGMTVNSDFGVPLNHLIWLNDYKMYGEDSYVFRNKDIWNELLRDCMFVNDAVTFSDVITMAEYDKKLGLALTALYNGGFTNKSITDIRSGIKNRDFVKELSVSTFGSAIYEIDEIKSGINGVYSSSQVKSISLTESVVNSEYEKTINADSNLLLIGRIAISYSGSIINGREASANVVINNQTYTASATTKADSSYGPVYLVGTPILDIKIPICEPINIKCKRGTDLAIDLEYAELD